MLLKRKVGYTHEEGTSNKRAKLSTVDCVEETSSGQTNNYYINCVASIVNNASLWLHQKQAYQRIHVALRTSKSEERRGKFLLVTLPTGTGKSGLAHIVPFGLKGRMLIITHNTDGVSQLYNSLKFLKDRNVISNEAALPKAYVIRNAEDLAHLPLRNNNHDLYITNIHKFITEGQWKETLCQFFSLIIIDEGHHAVAKTYNTVIVDQLIKHSVPIILLTATPRRRDKLPLQAELVYSLSLKEAIEARLIKHPCLVRYHPNVNGEFCEKGNELKRSSIKAVTVRKQMVEMMIDILRDKRQATGIHHQGIVVCSTKEDCKEIGNLFSALNTKINGNPIKYATYHSELPKISREYVKNQMISKELDCVIHCGLMTEGHDYPELSVTVIMCKVNWVGRFSQIVGRCTRYLHQSAHIIDNTAHVIINSWNEKNLWNDYQNELHAEVSQTNSFRADFETTLQKEEVVVYTESSDVPPSIRQKRPVDTHSPAKNFDKCSKPQIVQFVDGKWSVEAFKTNNEAIMNQISNTMSNLVSNSKQKKVVTTVERQEQDNIPNNRLVHCNPINTHPYNYFFPFMRTLRPQEVPPNAGSFELMSFFRRGKLALAQPSTEYYCNNNNNDE